MDRSIPIRIGTPTSRGASFVLRLDSFGDKGDDHRPVIQARSELVGKFRPTIALPRAGQRPTILNSDRINRKRGDDTRRGESVMTDQLASAPSQGALAVVFARISQI